MAHRHLWYLITKFVKNYQSLIKMASNIIFIVAFSGGLKCPQKFISTAHSARSKIVPDRVKKIYLVNTYLNQVICGRGEPSTLHTNSTVLPSAADMHWTLSKTLGALESSPSLGSAKLVSKSLYLLQIHYLLQRFFCNVIFATFCKEFHDYIMDEAWNQSSVSQVIEPGLLTQISYILRRPQNLIKKTSQCYLTLIIQ